MLSKFSTVVSFLQLLNMLLMAVRFGDFTGRITFSRNDSGIRGCSPVEAIVTPNANDRLVMFSIIDRSASLKE